jgi:hypothetical protein
MRATKWIKTIIIICTLTFIVMLQSFAPAKPDEPKPKNLKVLPKNISHDELIRTMKGYCVSLGVHCNECHYSTQSGDAKPEFDFASDAKPEKNTARKMIKMMDAINSKYLGKMNGGNLERITCVTCHRGNIKPLVSIDSLQKMQKH